ncbi:hypothetical protein DFJ63DRAFT_222071 [Scheffersomyces coipomensis]|uniref:uncharacterized protein n=1 Tax=Scheffersomyces coipomensis TaxID=1788519 RepID=UPI00315C7CBF
MAKEKRSKNALRRDKAKLRKLNNEPIKVNDSKKINSNEKTENEIQTDTEKNGIQPPPIEQEKDTEDIIIKDNELFKQFQGVFNAFNSKEIESKPDAKQQETKDEIFYNSGSDGESLEDSSDEDDEHHKPLSKRQLRIRNKVPLALLKASTARPQIVDWYDADAEDPYLLVALKSQPNSIPVPGHWSSKREYLAGKRGIERLPFELPEFIRDTGIMDMRNTNDQTIRQQQRDKVQPKMGRLDIDYQRLHDAFFKYQNKPKLFGFGDVYFEGREVNDEYSEDVLKSKPGIVSPLLRKALGMPENNLNNPPPWIDIMKKMGKPPTYINLTIPGIDVEYNNSGYKDKDYVPVEKEANWGALGEHEESEEEEDDDDEEVDDDEENEEDNEEVEYEEESEDDESKKEITEFGGVKTDFKSNVSADQFPEQPRSLFTVLNELGKGYDIPGESSSESKEKKNQENEHNNGHKEVNSTESNLVKNFKF